MDDKELRKLRFDQGWNAYVDKLSDPITLPPNLSTNEIFNYELGWDSAKAEHQKVGTVCFLLEELEDRMVNGSDPAFTFWIVLLRRSIAAYKEEQKEKKS